MTQTVIYGAAKLIGKGSDIVASALTNTLLYSLYLYGASFGKSGSLGVHRAFKEASGALEECNYQSIKNALYQLTKAGLVKRSRKRTSLEITITAEGNKRIHELYPSYLANRPWDGHVYLISYDIPTKNNKARNILREYIRRTGGALLQESLWLNPYNPTSIIEEFIETRSIPGTVLVSKLGTDGAIGDEKLIDLITRIYNYASLTKRYNTFIDTFTHTKNPSPVAVTLKYISILRDDPQLPFTLEPKGFPAAEANKIFEETRRRYTQANNNN